MRKKLAISLFVILIAGFTSAYGVVVGLYTDSTGNVGIGTTTPKSKLDVNGTLTVSGNINQAVNASSITNPSSGNLLMYADSHLNQLSTIDSSANLYGLTKPSHYDYMVTTMNGKSVLLDTNGNIKYSQSYGVGNDDAVLINKAIKLGNNGKNTIVAAGSLNIYSPIALSQKYTNLIQIGSLHNYITNGSGMIRFYTYNTGLYAQELVDETAMLGTAIEIMPVGATGVAWAHIDVQYALGFNKAMTWNIKASTESFINDSFINIYADSGNYGIFIPDTSGGGFGTASGDNITFQGSRINTKLIYFGTGSNTNSLINLASDMGGDNPATVDYQNLGNGNGNTLITGSYVNPNKVILYSLDSQFGANNIFKADTNIGTHSIISESFFKLRRAETTPLKASFIDTSNGKAIDARWNQRIVVGTPTFGVNDALNGGYTIQLDTGAWSRARLDFNNAQRAFDETKSEAIFVISTNSTTDANIQVGLANDATNVAKNSIMINIGSSFANIELRTYDNTSTETDTSTGVARDTNTHEVRIKILDSTHVSVWVDGSPKITSQLMTAITGHLQPFIDYAKGSVATTPKATILYSEANNN